MTVRALVVDDSPSMCAAVAQVLGADPDIEVVGAAHNADAARSAIKALDPDVITLDVEMPGMSGLDFLERLMRLRPMPVVMLSSLTAAGAETSLKALELGAFDCADKAMLRGLDVAASARALAHLVKAAAHARIRGGARPPAAPVAAAVPALRSRPEAVIAIGASTGGVEALIELLGGFPADCPPTLIVQHMPESFTASFAARLDRLTAPRVAEARSGAMLQRGQVYLAPGGARHLELAGAGGRRHCRLVEGDRVNGHRPSVDRLFASVARSAGADAAGAILTGMGNDGAAGLRAMRDAGAVTLGQDEASSVVYGMPAAAFAAGAVAQQLPLSRIAARLMKACAA